MSETEIQYILTINTEMTRRELARLEIVIMRVLGYIKQMTGSEDLAKFISIIQKTITAIRMLQISLYALEAASGPIGIAYAGLSMATTALTFSDILQGY